MTGSAAYPGFENIYCSFLNKNIWFAKNVSRKFLLRHNKNHTFVRACVLNDVFAKTHNLQQIYASRLIVLLYARLLKTVS